MKLQRFRQRVDEFEAVRVTHENVKDVCDWITSMVHAHKDSPKVKPREWDHDKLGVVNLYYDFSLIHVQPGDWVVLEPPWSTLLLFGGMKHGSFTKKYEEIS